MDIIDWYGYLPKGYTFEDYHRDAEKRKNKNKDSIGSGEKPTNLHDEDKEATLP